LKLKHIALTLLSSALLLTGCTDKPYLPSKLDYNKMGLEKSDRNRVFYEIFVRSFSDSNGDGIGDIQGMTAKLDYLKDLGIEGIWLMPINPSPSYHGYDVTDYQNINKDYGTLDDFKTFVKEAHKRDMKVVIDFVVNHTSKEHPWFQKALDGDTAYRGYYNWATKKTDTTKLGDWNQNVWHGSGEDIYEGIFWDGMPDLNFENQKVRSEIINAGSFWLREMDVDGFRLDAAKHIYSDSEEKDHKWWKDFRSEMEKVKPDVFLVGEVWDNPSVVTPYFKNGLDSTFNFDLSEKLITSVQDESDAGIVSSLFDIRETYRLANKDYTDSIFITNHDMDRIMSQVSANKNHAKMAASLLLTLPGSPFIYYGEELGMEGVKPDENIREPFPWSESSSYNTGWMEPFYNIPGRNNTAKAQMKDESSLYHHYKTLIHVRRTSDALINGEIIDPDIIDYDFISFIRETKDESLLVIHNLTGKKKTIELNEKTKEYKNLYYSLDEKNELNKGKIKMEPYSTIILKK